MCRPNFPLSPRRPSRRPANHHNGPAGLGQHLGRFTNPLRFRLGALGECFLNHHGKVTLWVRHLAALNSLKVQVHRGGSTGNALPNRLSQQVGQLVTVQP